jgi:hypothetical protein
MGVSQSSLDFYKRKIGENARVFRQVAEYDYELTEAGQTYSLKISSLPTSICNRSSLLGNEALPLHNERITESKEAPTRVVPVLKY